MVKKKTELFIDLSWNDLRAWAGSKIVSRGRDYQRQKLVSKLTMLDNGGLLAWVDGTHRYATQVAINEDGLPESTCTCPDGCDCKHGVAVVLEYLEQIKKDKRVPRAAKDDERLLLFDKERWDDDMDDVQDEDDLDYGESPLTKKTKPDIAAYLDGKTKTQLIELIYDLANKYPKMAQELTDLNQLVSGNVKSLITRLKKDIHQISSEYGWQNHWDDDREKNRQRIFRSQGDLYFKRAACFRIRQVIWRFDLLPGYGSKISVRRPARQCDHGFYKKGRIYSNRAAASRGRKT